MSKVFKAIGFAFVMSLFLVSQAISLYFFVLGWKFTVPATIILSFIAYKTIKKVNSEKKE
jgi:hypothetical protein